MFICREEITGQLSLSCVNTIFFFTFGLNFRVFIPLGIHTCSSFAGGAAYKGKKWPEQDFGFPGLRFLAPNWGGERHQGSEVLGTHLAPSPSWLLMIFVSCETAEMGINPHLVMESAKSQEIWCIYKGLVHLSVSVLLGFFAGQVKSPRNKNSADFCWWGVWSTSLI